MALRAKLLELLNPLFVSRSQHGSGKPLPRPCASKREMQGCTAGRATLGSVPAWVGEVRSVPPPSTRMAAARAVPQQVGEKAAWRRQHGYGRAQRRIGRCAIPPSSRIFTVPVDIKTREPGTQFKVTRPRHYRIAIFTNRKNDVHVGKRTHT